MSEPKDLLLIDQAPLRLGVQGGPVMSRVVHVPYTIEQDEDGVWCAHAQLRPGVGAHGQGDTRESAIADLREALVGLISEFGAPNELTVTLDVA